MQHDELMASLELEVGDGFEFTEDQADVIHAYHEGSDAVAVGAGAGTGKTTTLTRAVGESVLREATPSPANCDANPFDDILVMTFMRNAANELKTTIKEVLRDHQANTESDLDQNLWRWAETGSHINTINAFTMELLREAAVDAHVDPGFDIRDELETQDLLRDIRAELLEDDDLAAALEFLSDELDEYDDPEPLTLIYNLQQKLREFGEDFDTITEDLLDRVEQDLHQGYETPLDADEVRDIVETLCGTSPGGDDTAHENITEITETYEHNRAYAEAVGDLVAGFEDTYDELTREQGALTYTDVTYLVLQHLEHPDGEDFAASLRNRFSHIFVDEFQDTSYAQCRIISHLLPDNSGEEGPNLMIIGDTKQAIYSWRSADPSIFAEILEHDPDSGEPDSYLGVQNWRVQDLTSNFRSHPDIVRAANGLFSEVFDHPGRGAISDFEVAYNDLYPARNPIYDESSVPSDNPSADPNAHVHALPLNEGTADEWRNAEPERIAETIRGVVDNETLVVEADGQERPMKPGDVTLLFRASTRLHEFRSALNNYGLENAVVAEKGLFASEEVQFIIDVLDWFANPHSKDSLLRILRSPVTALADRTLRFIASKEHDPTRALADWPADRLPASDKERLETLVDLRSDFRWDREDAKANLIQKIIQHTGLETILLTGDDARKRYGNLWMLVEVVRDWEEEELLPYREFVSRLREYRNMARGGSEQFEVAQVADDNADETVKLRTVHSAKGLEFNVVVLADLMQGEYASPLGADFIPVQDDEGSRTVALHPREAENQVSFSTGAGSNWVTNGAASTIWLSTSRDDDESLQYPHPYNSALANQFAEYWRLLYVAFTRAEDHLLMPLGNDYFWSKKHSWGALLHDHFGPATDWPDGENATLNGERYQHDRIVCHPEDDGPASIPMSTGELPRGDEFTATPIGIDLTDDEHAGNGSDESEDDVGGTWDGVGFVPRTLRPSMLYDIIDCPRRFQYQTLQEITDSHGESPPGTNKPDGVSASAWGQMVHDALEAYHRDLRQGDIGASDSRYDECLAEESEEAAARIREVVEEYRDETATWSEVQEAETVLPEYELSAQHPSDPNVHLSGFTDLLYARDGEWVIVDFKTGEELDEDADLFKQYKWQLATYVWLLREEYDIEASAARLVYVHEGVEKTLDLEWSLLSDFLEELPERLNIISEQGLPTRPSPEPDSSSPDKLPLDTRCGACPYTEICPEWE